jgi:hypothetical protein
MGDGATEDARFQTLFRRVLDGIATEEERGEFTESLDGHPERIGQYVELLAVMAAAASLGEGGAFQAEDRGLEVESGTRASAWPPAGGRRCRWRRAAAALLLLGGAAALSWVVWMSSRFPASHLRPLTSDLRSLTSDLRSPVALTGQAGAVGMALPASLPGTLHLAAGQAEVRLTSGVRLVLLGPLELEVRDAMTVRLASGRLLADVPPVASGFTVRTPELELWDIGTVFGVSVSNGVSDVFVFKGEVQVNEASGDAVDLCREGEGVRAQAGRMPHKVAADWPEARRLFASVKVAGVLADPTAAFAAAERIAEMWEERYLPEEAWRVRERAARLAASLAAPARVPFSKSAWVRPAAPARQQEENMRATHSAAALAAAAVTMGAGWSAASSAPVMVDADLHGRRWTTVFTNAVPLSWEWEAGATHARLDIVGMNSAGTVPFAAASSGYLWAIPGTPAPTEDVYDLTLTFYGAGDAVVGALTSRLAVVSGVFSATIVNAVYGGGPEWTRVKDSAVIPYDAGWTAATDGASEARLVIAKEGGMTRTNALPDAAGYAGWKLKGGDWGYGSFGLSLTFPGTEGGWDAALTRIPEGTMLSVR